MYQYLMIVSNHLVQKLVPSRNSKLLIELLLILMLLGFMVLMTLGEAHAWHRNNTGMLE